MQRSYLLSIDFKVHSITDWAAQLKINPLYAILSGFDFGNTPHIRPLKKKKVKQPKQKGAKAQPF